MAPRQPRASLRRRTASALTTVGALLAAGMVVAPAAQALGTQTSWLEAAYNATSIGDSGASNADFDGLGGYFIRDLMADVPALTPGADNTLPGDASMHYVLGGTVPGVFDSVVGKSQSNDVSATLGHATKIAFIGAASIATQTSDVILGYADGTSQTVSVTLTDWCSDAPAGGNSSLGRTPKRWFQGSEQALSCGLWYTPTTTLRTTSTLASITWPQNQNFHVFAVATDATPAVLPVSGTVTLPASIGVGHAVALDPQDLPGSDLEGVTYGYTWKVDGTAVSTSAGYVVHEADLGKALTVTVTAHRSGYVPASVTSAPVTVQAGFQAVTAPQVEGTAGIGETLTIGQGQYTETGVTEAYQWYADGVPVPGATSSSLVVAYAQTGKDLTVRVTASKPGFGSLVRETGVVAVPQAPALTGGTPRVSGTPTVGATLTATPGSYSLPGVSVAYQWLRDGAAIAGAAGSTYVLTQADAGTRVSVRAVGTKALYDPLVTVSAPTAVVGGGKIGVTRGPAVSGTAAVGSRLSVVPGVYSVPGVKATYQWLRGSAAIPGATGATYTARPADKGARLSLRTTVVRTGFTTLTLTSGATAPVKAGKIVVRKKPKIKGKAKVGKKLKATKGKYTPGGVKIAYRWLRNGKAIKGASKKTYKVSAKDARKKLSVRVKVKKAGYKKVKVTSKKTAKAKR